MVNRTEKDDKLIRIAQSLKEDIEASEGLGEHIIKRLSSLSISDSSEKRAFSFFFSSRPALASAMISAAVLLIICLPLFLQSDHKQSVFNEGAISIQRSSDDLLGESDIIDPLKIDAKKADGSVMLSWESKEKNIYKITRSTSPRDFSNAYTVMVAGNSWTDPLKNDSNIIYYKIE